MAINRMESDFNGEGLRIGVVTARFNAEVTETEEAACVAALTANGVAQEDITVVSVPGALEIPLSLAQLAETGRFDALIALGAVIRGETYHFEVVSNESCAGVSRVSLEFHLPVANGITIPPNATNISISNDGAVSATVPGNTQPQPLGNLAMSGFVNAGGLEPIGQNLFKESAASGQPQQGTPGTNGLGIIKQGFLESSNVNVVEELVGLIQAQRAYEINSKAISTSDQMLQRLSQL